MITSQHTISLFYQKILILELTQKCPAHELKKLNQTLASLPFQRVGNKGGKGVEFKKKAKGKDSFILDLRENPKIFLVGNKDDL